jgi:hypothetical protein
MREPIRLGWVPQSKGIPTIAAAQLRPGMPNGAPSQVGGGTNEGDWDRMASARIGAGVKTLRD